MLTAPVTPSLHRTAALLHRSRATDVQFELHTEASADRDRLQHYIAEHYQQIHGARVTEFLPLLLAMQNGETPLAALGLRPGGCGPMFLEHYLDNRIEQTIAERARQPVFRGNMIEIGNLVATSPGSSQLLFVVLTAALAAAGYRWMVFTGTPQVRKLINRLNYNPITVSAADPARLGDMALKWGRYYSNGPQVMAGSIPDAFDTLCNTGHGGFLIETHRTLIDGLAQCLRDHRRICGA